MSVEQFSERILNWAPGSASGYGDDPVRTHELRTLFDVFLPDASDEEVHKIEIIQHSLQGQQRRLEELFELGVIGADEYARSVNDEISRAIKLCSRVLGTERAQRLLGVEEQDSAILVVPELVDRGLEQLSQVRAITEPLKKRYVPARREQIRVSRAVHKVNPQQWHKGFEKAWGGGHKYQVLLDAIIDADNAYHHGNLLESATVTARVLEHISGYDQITDEPFYLVAWAFHMSGRAREKLQDFQSAELCYKASLDLKLTLKEWLPSLALLATEIKLGSVGIGSHPLEGLVILIRVEEYLALASKSLTRQNEQLDRNLLVDSRIALADAYLRVGRNEEALQVAELATRGAQALNDAVATSKLLRLVAKARHDPIERVRAEFDRIHWPEKEWFRLHPDVRPIWQELEWEPTVTTAPTARTVSWKAIKKASVGHLLRRASKKK